MYSEDEHLPLSGIQHFSFCRRQWALIHIEQIWTDNILTVQGSLMHERAHDSSIKERRNGIIVVRDLRVHSNVLGISGACDVVEFHAASDGYPLFGEKGLWKAIPIEYKRGSSKSSDADRLQLCAQALCLEEMFVGEIAFGYLFYGQTKSREKVIFSSELREAVRQATMEMHHLYNRNYIPKVKSSKACRSCSIVEFCNPKTISRSAKGYISDALRGEL